MRISAVMSHMNKVLQYMRECESSDTAYYPSTLDKFAEIASMCTEITDICSRIAHTDRKQTVNTAKTVVDMQDAIKQLSEQFDQKMAEMQSQIDQLSDKIGSADNTPSIIIGDSLSKTDGDAEKTDIAKVVVPSSDPDTQVDIAISRVTKKENSENAKKAAKAYDTALRKVVNANHTYFEMAELSQLLYDWHSKRFMNNYRYNCKFKYSYKRVRKLISLITIAYGYHIEQNDIEQFKSTFREFLDKIGTDPQTTDCFAVPYEINKLEKEYDSAYDNLTSVALYSQLFDLGLSDLHFRGGIPFDYRLECDDVGTYFTMIPDDSVNDADTHPERFLSKIPTTEELE